MCRNCGKDFNEKENFNWSCRTHYSEFGGEVWWCCLKKGQKALGCKFDKHDGKEQEDEEEEDEEKKKLQNKNTRCNCCKELGHFIEDCPRDPNLRTNADPSEEEERIK